MKDDKDTFVVQCNKCKTEWEQKVIGLMDINWICPKCETDEASRIIKYVPSDEGFYERETSWGRGGAKHA